MIRPITKDHIPACAQVIRESFLTVANTYGITPENAPAFTAFSMTDAKLLELFELEKRPMFAWFQDGQIVGHYNLKQLSETEWELNNLAVLPQNRHQGIGEALLDSAFREIRARGGKKVCIGIVEENQPLRRWYERFGFLHTGTEKFDFFPFTCGYMEKEL